MREADVITTLWFMDKQVLAVVVMGGGMVHRFVDLLCS